MHPVTRTSRRRGFSLVELLVVVAILAMLVGLVVPAVQQARLAASRTESQSSLRQVGLAILSHHDARRAFPFASGRPRRGIVSHKEHTHAHAAGEIDGAVRPQAWAISIMGYVEEPALAAIYDTFCLACRPEDQPAEVVDARVKLYNGRCDAPGGLDFAALVGHGPVFPDAALRLDRWYFASMVSAVDFDGVLIPEGLGWIDGDSAYAVTVASKPVRLAEVRDGTSATLMVAESGDYTTDDGATWQTPRYSWPYVSDVARYSAWGMGSGGTPLERSLKPRSRIAGGLVQAVGCDGAVRPIDDSIAPAVLAAIVSRADGDVGPR